MFSLVWAELETPIGKIFLQADAVRLHTCTFENPGSITGVPNHPILSSASHQLHEYFAGRRKQFDILLNFEARPFYQKVWNLIEQVEYGQTTSYKSLASLLALKNGARAIGGAVGANPLLIFIPCHRVLGDKGSLTGYAGGIDRKRFLLQLEQKHSTSNRKDLLF